MNLEVLYNDITRCIVMGGPKRKVSTALNLVNFKQTIEEFVHTLQHLDDRKEMLMVSAFTFTHLQSSNNLLICVNPLLKQVTCRKSTTNTE